MAKGPSNKDHLFRNDAVDAFAVLGWSCHVDFACFVVPKGEDGEAIPWDRNVANDFARSFVVLQRPQFAGNVITVKIVAVEFRVFRTAVHGAASDGLADLVIVFPDRFDDVGAGRRPGVGEDVAAFTNAPPVVPTFLHNVDLFPDVLADVGQDIWEEINIVKKGGNYGWSIREGRHIFANAGSSASADVVEPIWEYDHQIGKSITGGTVYRGSKHAELDGHYLYGDYVAGKLWALKYDEAAGKVIRNVSIPWNGLPVLAFGDDEAGEVYVTTPAQNGKGIYRIVAE